MFFFKPVESNETFDQTLVASTIDGRLVALSSRTGQVKWTLLESQRYNIFTVYFLNWKTRIFRPAFASTACRAVGSVFAARSTRRNPLRPGRGCQATEKTSPHHSATGSGERQLFFWWFSTICHVLKRLCTIASTIIISNIMYLNKLLSYFICFSPLNVIFNTDVFEFKKLRYNCFSCSKSLKAIFSAKIAIKLFVILNLTVYSLKNRYSYAELFFEFQNHYIVAFNW